MPTKLEQIHAERRKVAQLAKVQSIRATRPQPCYARPPQWLAILVGA